MENLLERITFNKDVLSGKPPIRELRIPVELVVELLVKGATAQEILENYPELELEDIQAALLYAHHVLAGEQSTSRRQREVLNRV